MIALVAIALVLVPLAIIVGLTALYEHTRREAIGAFFRSRGGEVWMKPTTDEKITAFSAIGNAPQLLDGPIGVKWAVQLNSHGLPAWIVEHSYTRRRGKRSRTYTHTLISIPVPPAWAFTMVSRQTLWNKIEGLWNDKGMLLENEVFNKTFRVETNDENFALVFLTPSLQEWLLATPDNWSISIRDGFLHVFTTSAANAAWLPALCAAPAQVLARTTPELLTAGSVDT